MPVGKEAVLDVGLPGTDHATGSNAVTLGDVGASSVTARPEGSGFTTREDIKKQRKLEEARKSGLIPAEKDEEGKDINPHIPQYIAKAPWYLSQDSKPSLRHQRHAESPHGSVQNWYKRGFIDQPQRLTYRPGACENCGAMTHTAKDCTERPRKKGARWTGKDIRPDELLVADSAELKLDFDGKRDRYGGYDPVAYRQVIRDFELADLERKKRRAQELKEGIDHTKSKRKRQKMREKLSKIEGDEKAEEAHSGSEEPSTSGAEDDDEELEESEEEEEEGEDDVKVKDFDEANAPIGMKDDRTRTTTRNLRIREDTAKYLFNLDVNSAFYDPKTRSMRDNPLRHLKETEQGTYRGDNAMRLTGEAPVVKQMELFAWEAYKYNVTVHSQAQPTQLELMHREYHRKQQELVDLKKRKLLEKYGGEEHLNAPQELLLSQTEVYREYNPLDGTVKRTGERALLKSKYNDDSLFGEHTEVWGSWNDRATGMWGYLCCKQHEKANPDCSGNSKTS